MNNTDLLQMSLMLKDIYNALETNKELIDLIKSTSFNLKLISDLLSRDANNTFYSEKINEIFLKLDEVLEIEKIKEKQNGLTS